MRRSRYVIPGAIATALITMVSAKSAKAAGTAAPEVVESKPNTDLIASGIFTIGIPYVASAAVAAQSDHMGDDRLYIPVAGPWMDLANRGTCGQGRVNTCETETFYKALLVGDGILQGIGALELLGGLLYPEPHTTTVARPNTPTIRVAPAAIGYGGYGLGAAGTF